MMRWDRWIKHTLSLSWCLQPVAVMMFFGIEQLRTMPVDVFRVRSSACGGSD